MVKVFVFYSVERIVCHLNKFTFSFAWINHDQKLSISTVDKEKNM